MKPSTIILVTVVAAWIAAGLVGALGSLRTLEHALEPWLALCRWITPEGWQTRGNVPLGLLWVVSGVSAYGLALSIVPAAISARCSPGCRGRGARSAPPSPRRPPRRRHPRAAGRRA